MQLCIDSDNLGRWVLIRGHQLWLPGGLSLKPLRDPVGFNPFHRRAAALVFSLLLPAPAGVLRAAPECPV